MIVNKNLATSRGHLLKDLWETPDYIFNSLDEEFGFTLDPCCTYETRKCDNYFTPEDDGLHRNWVGHRVFMNPPYSRGNIDQWVEKCYWERNDAQVIVALLPVSTSSKWFHQWIWNKSELRFLQGRIKFKGAPFTAPFSSMLAIYRPDERNDI